MVVATGLGFLLFFIGTALFVFYGEHPDRGGIGFDSNRVFAKFMAEEMPPGLTGLMVGAVLAASISTVSSVLNSLATVSITDLYTGAGRPEAFVRLARFVTGGFGLVGTAAACFGGAFGNVLEATMTISNFFGGSLVGGGSCSACLSGGRMRAASRTGPRRRRRFRAACHDRLEARRGDPG